MRTIEEIKQSIADMHCDQYGFGCEDRDFYDIHRELIAAQDAEIERLRPYAEWQPIETAPAEQFILTHNPKWRVPMAAIRGREFCGWTFLEYGPPDDPTHWLPIPPLPEGEGYE